MNFKELNVFYCLYCVRVQYSNIGAACVQVFFN